jgi:hypothetical protein
MSLVISFEHLSFKRLEQILGLFLWSEYGCERGLLMVPWEVCTMPKEEGGLSLIDVVTQGHILATKWIVRCLEGFAPWKILLWYCF